MADLVATASPQVLIEGSEIAPEIVDDLFALRVQKSTGASSQATIRFRRAADHTNAFAVGKQLAVNVVDAEARAVEVFSGHIVSVGVDVGHGRSDLTVEAFDLSHRLGQTVVYESHLNASPNEVISRMAQEVGLTAQVDSALHAVRPQIQQAASPHVFLSQLAHVYGCEWFVDGSKLVVERRRLRGSKVTLTGGVDLSEFSVRFSGSEQANAIEVRGWDPATRDSVSSTVQSDGSASLHAVTAITTARTASVAENAIGWPTTTTNATDAEQVAKGVQARMEAAAVTGRGETDANAALTPGCTVTIDNVIPDWNGDYYVNGVEHVFGRDQSFVTRFRIGGTTPSTLVDLFGRGGARGDSSTRLANGVTVGEVTNLADPDKLGRVKVRLPYLSDEHETDWCRVVQLGAGAERGFQMMPEVDDEVLVAFQHGEIGHPVVLGGLWGGVAKTKNIASIKDGQVEERSITTRTGHALRFAEGQGDDDQHITIVHAEGTAVLVLGKTKLELKADGVPVEVSTDDASILMDAGTLTLKANDIVIDAAQSVEIKANSVNSKSDTSTDIEAGTAATVKGNASAELSASGNTTVKGAMVAIN